MGVKKIFGTIILQVNTHRLTESYLDPESAKRVSKRYVVLVLVVVLSDFPFFKALSFLNRS